MRTVEGLELWAGKAAGYSVINELFSENLEDKNVERNASDRDLAEEASEQCLRVLQRLCWDHSCDISELKIFENENLCFTGTMDTDYMGLKTQL